jgi:hypothetical protein
MTGLIPVIGPQHAYLNVPRSNDEPVSSLYAPFEKVLKQMSEDEIINLKKSSSMCRWQFATIHDSAIAALLQSNLDIVTVF